MTTDPYPDVPDSDGVDGVVIVRLAEDQKTSIHVWLLACPWLDAGQREQLCECALSGLDRLIEHEPDPDG
ncbi:hypothetical protein [Streptomyces sp. NPDC000229]|uniref:hypothetical protein n=1 Tax=Streptomyces sp. NPDC000229 TaxID=3154247 RepID=UPI0033202F03